MIKEANFYCFSDSSQMMLKLGRNIFGLKSCEILKTGFGDVISNSKV